MSKMPYIADKKLYAAVMFACKMIRENGYFNKDVKIAANYYNVSEEDVAAEVRKRQGAGQKRSAKENPRTYHWYAITWYQATDVGWPDELDKINRMHYEVKKAASAEHAERRLPHVPDPWNYPDGYEPITYVDRIVECDTEEAAKEALATIVVENKMKKAEIEEEQERNRLKTIEEYGSEDGFIKELINSLGKHNCNIPEAPDD